MAFNKPKMLVIGLDCAAPQLVFDRWADLLPNLTELRKQGIWGDLTSTIPPITVPAWSCMMTSQDPGQLGIYGFRNRADYSYDNLSLANSRAVKQPRVWNYLSRNRKKSILLGVPQTYPVRPLNGIMVASFMTPDKSSTYTYPESIAEELDRIAEGDYIIDVRDFRTAEKDRLLESIYTMTRRRFKVVREWLQTKPWDFFMFVEMGVDRIHHGFWRYSDPKHRLYQPGHKYEHAIRDYYIYLDEEIGNILEDLPPQTSIAVVSDHGARNMEGGIAINEWLIKQGELKLIAYPKEQTGLTPEMIDWSGTRIWGEGGYYGRIFLNVRDREPQGTIAPEDYEKTRNGIAEKIKIIPGPDGQPIGTVVYRPEDVYREVNGIAPDLIVYFGDLSWRSVGSVGGGEILVFDNDTGPDDANHDQQGIIILNSDLIFEQERGSCRKGMSIYDVAPTILTAMGISVPEEMIGCSLV